MAAKTPLIDDRTYDELVKQTEALAQSYTDWEPGLPGTPGLGQALIRIFVRMAERVIERLNQAPDKHFLAFLDLIGTRLQPARPARVPLTFQLAQGTTQSTLIPAGVQVAAAAEGAQGELIFETEQDLVASPAQVQALFVHEPQNDSYGDYTGRNLSALNGFPAFAGDKPVEHCLYLACDEIFTIPGPKTVTLTINSEQVEQLNQLPIYWSYWDGAVWQSLTVTESAVNTEIKGWTVRFEDPPIPTLREIDGQTAAWLQARLDLPLVYHTLSPFGVDGKTKSFQLYLGDAFTSKEVIIKLGITLARKGQSSDDVVLRWEAGNGRNLLEIGTSSSKQSSVGSSKWYFEDTTHAFTSNGCISFQVPPSLVSSLDNGPHSCWLRVEISSEKGYSIAPEIDYLSVYPWSPPKVTHISVSVSRTDITPDLAFANTMPLDLSKDFYPFGEEPRLGDVFCIASKEAFSGNTAGDKVTAKITLTADRTVNPSPNLKIVWEVWDGQEWRFWNPVYCEQELI